MLCIIGKMEITLFCPSCEKEMKLDEKEYEKHILENHPKKVNVKEMCFRAYIWRKQ